MNKLLLVTLVLSSAMMTNGLIIKEKRAQRVQGSAGNRKDGVDAALALESRQMNATVFDLTGCLQKMPQLQYTAYEAASFCRSYMYSCNNLWPEELYSEVIEGSYCLINAFEKNTPEPQKKEQTAMFHKLASTVVEPYYAFMFDFFKYTSKKTFIDLSKNDVEGAPPGEGPKDKAALLQCQDASEKPKVECMIQNMKTLLSKVGKSKPDLSKLSKKQALKLFGKAKNVTDGLEKAGEAKLAFDPNNIDIGKLLEKFPKLGEMGLLDTSNPVEGPMKSSLGTLKYKNSAPHHTGPIAPNTRYPHDAVQQGLELDIFDLSTMDERAVCNDGSAGKMYIGPTTSMTKWHFHFDGGFFCYDKKTCMERAHYSTPMVSTKGYETSKNNSGMFDPINGGFPEYTHATAVYCSSDAWMGQIEVEDFQLVGGTTLSNGNPGTYFHGYFILEAVLKKFIAMGMGETEGQELWISGCSAGSIAGTAMADSWAPRLKALGMKNEVYIWTMLDNAPILSPPAVHGQKSIHTMAMTLVDFLYGPTRGVSPDAFINQKCVAAHPTEPQECIFPGTGIRFIDTPNLVLNQIWDNFVTAKTYGFMHPVTSIQYNTGLQIAKDTKEIFKTVGKTQNFWAISCGDHCMSSNPTFWRYVPNTATEKISARDMAIQTRDGSLGRVVQDECIQYNCGCVGQSTSMTKLTANSLYFMVMNRLAPGMNPLRFMPTLSLTTGIAADMFESPGQFLLGP